MAHVGRLARRAVKGAIMGFGLVFASQSQPANAGFAYCSAPMAPSFFATKPSKPYCAMTSNCERWEVDIYNSEIEQYFKRLKQYLTDVDQFQIDAYDYAKCMAKLD
jgi:hypothetical protein